jgi:hypothetical protein
MTTQIAPDRLALPPPLDLDLVDAGRTAGWIADNAVGVSRVWRRDRGRVCRLARLLPAMRGEGAPGLTRVVLTVLPLAAAAVFVGAAPFVPTPLAAVLFAAMGAGSVMLLPGRRSR